jgi:predicted metal-dependent enzyme (double-stranded beta helix superfamily)
MASPFSDFINEVKSTMDKFSEPNQIVMRIEPRLHDLVLNHDWLSRRFRRSLPDKPYSQYLLFSPPDKLFSVVSFVWRPDSGSPIHDHCTWGVIGQYEGEEEETRFRRSDDGTISEASVSTFKAGDVAHVYPPDRDIHRIFNHTATPTVSVHVYGGDIGTQARHVFDPSGKTRPFMSGYDTPPPD